MWFKTFSLNTIYVVNFTKENKFKSSNKLILLLDIFNKNFKEIIIRLIRVFTITFSYVKINITKNITPYL